jgi:hypothetical protein
MGKTVKNTTPAFEALPPIPPLLVHLHVPRATKLDWINRSRVEGKRLSFWIRECVERT